MEYYPTLDELLQRPPNPGDPICGALSKGDSLFVWDRIASIGDGIVNIREPEGIPIRVDQLTPGSIIVFDSEKKEDRVTGAWHFNG